MVTLTCGKAEVISPASSMPTAPAPKMSTREDCSRLEWRRSIRALAITEEDSMCLAGKG